jgi:hypothetical protein
MNRLTIFILIINISLYSANAQKISNTYNKFTNLEGTEFCVASVETWDSKLFGDAHRSLLFINTLTGDKKEINFPQDAKIKEIKQIKIDSLRINQLLVVAGTLDGDGKKGIDWNDPKQVIIFSPSGNEKYQLTEDNFFTGSYGINELTGTLIVSGFFDTNKNNKQDTNENSEILLYDLQTFKLKKKI